MNDFGASSPLLGDILALYPLRNDFGASSPLLGDILALHPCRDDFWSFFISYTRCNPSFYILHVGEICPCIE
jgi:hypothetical protein